jgi:hypothetical protein
MCSTIPSIPSSSFFDNRMLSAIKTTHDIDERLQPLDLYAIPNDQRLRHLVSRFCTTTGTVLPYIDAKSLLQDSEQSTEGSIWQTSQAGRALLNIVCAHAALVERSTDAEIFYRRAHGLLQGLTLRGSSLELSTKNDFFSRIQTEVSSTGTSSAMCLPTKYSAIDRKLDIPLINCESSLSARITYPCTIRRA